MQEIEIDISNQQSNFIDISLIEYAETVVTLYDDVRAIYSKSLAKVKNEHWIFEDLEVIRGTKEEKLIAFQRVRKQMESKIKDFLSTQKEHNR